MFYNQTSNSYLIIIFQQSSLKMPLTVKERMKRHRDRMKEDPEKHKGYLQKENARWKKRREEKKAPPLIREMSKRDARTKRKYWKKEIKETKEERRQLRDDTKRVRSDIPSIKSNS